MKTEVVITGAGVFLCGGTTVGGMDVTEKNWPSYSPHHGYNATYSHTGCSFRSALEDAMMQLQLGDISSAMDRMHLPGTEYAAAIVLSVNPK